jgi:hypothetical protein
MGATARTEHHFIGGHLCSPLVVKFYLCCRQVLIDLGGRMVDARRVAATIGGDRGSMSKVDDANGPIERHFNDNVFAYRDVQ